jgi:hypothetical protein
MTCICGHVDGRHQMTNLGNITHCADCGCSEFRSEWKPLVDDHSMALEFVREIAAMECLDADCGHCLPCRATKWLHS